MWLAFKVEREVRNLGVGVINLLRARMKLVFESGVSATGGATDTNDAHAPGPFSSPNHSQTTSIESV